VPVPILSFTPDVSSITSRASLDRDAGACPLAVRRWRDAALAGSQSMRLGLVVLLCILNVGCAITRRDREEPVDNGPREEKAEPVLKPSEVLKPKSSEIASPINDHFWVRGTYFQGDVTTVMRIDSTGSTVPDGTVMSGEDDLGLDDVVNQGRMEFNLRMGNRNNVRIDYFKLNRFGEVILTDPISFSDFDFAAGDRFRTELDWSTLSLTYTYSPVKTDRFEWGLGLGAYIFDFRAEGGEPGTLNNKEDTEAGIFPAASTFITWRISRRWAFNVRHSQIKVGDDDADGKFEDSHAEVQFRWRPNLAFGVGYSSLHIDLDVHDDDEPFLFDLECKGPEAFFRASF
jgi:hypothetical protein